MKNSRKNFYLDYKLLVFWGWALLVLSGPIYSQTPFLDKYEWTYTVPAPIDHIAPHQSWRYAGLLSIQLDVILHNQAEINAFEVDIAIRDLFNFYDDHDLSGMELVRRGHTIRFHSPGLSRPFSRSYIPQWPLYAHDRTTPNPYFGWYRKEYGKAILAMKYLDGGAIQVSLGLLLKESRVQTR